jgi:hypothetical protein
MSDDPKATEPDAKEGPYAPARDKFTWQDAWKAERDLKRFERTGRVSRFLGDAALKNEAVAEALADSAKAHQPAKIPEIIDILGPSTETSFFSEGPTAAPSRGGDSLPSTRRFLVCENGQPVQYEIPATKYTPEP